ncbi:MAG: hypothetical protein IPN68_08290 [Bacteroidetes bacterium]|nr:hypothetical protein [Bacteroidota bacterium]
MKIYFFMAVLLLTGLNSNSQNLIGYKAIDIKKYMSENRIDMNLDKVNNKSFSYFKYSDKYDAQTVLFFLTPDSVCKNVRIVCNNSIRSTKLKELDSVYSKSGENTWTDKRSGKNYRVSLINDEWSFSITIEPEN